MLYHAKEIKQVIQKNMETIVLYTFGRLDSENSDEAYLEEYSYEFEEYTDRVAQAFDELLENRQFDLTTETIQFILEYEMIGLTCRPHPHKNSTEMRALAVRLQGLYHDKLTELNQRWES